MMLMRLGFALGLAVAAVWLLTHRDMIDLGIIEPALRSLGIWAPVGFVAIYAIGTVLFFSGALLGLAGGALSVRSGARSGTCLVPRSARQSPSCWPAALPANGWRGVSEDGCDA